MEVMAQLGILRVVMLNGLLLIKGGEFRIGNANGMKKETILG
jgi:hypothetical protein